jgi:hypothetical protein
LYFPLQHTSLYSPPVVQPFCSYTNIGIDNHFITFINFGLVDINQKGLEGNYNIGCKRKPYHPWTIFLWLQYSYIMSLVAKDSGVSHW